jgi:c-di-GMP-binding flagellar brake protein YcgR
MMNGRPVSAEAVVLYSHRFGEGPFGDAGMGLKFLRIQPTDQEEIRRYIRSEITQGIIPPGPAGSSH